MKLYQLAAKWHREDPEDTLQYLCYGVRRSNHGLLSDMMFHPDLSRNNSLVFEVVDEFIGIYLIRVLPHMVLGVDIRSATDKELSVQEKAWLLGIFQMEVDLTSSVWLMHD